MKGEKTTQEVSDYIKSNYDIYINRNFISKLWNGEDVGLSNIIKQSLEYLNMLNNTKKRTIKTKKFTDEEIVFLKTFKGSLSECSKEFEKHFNKNVTRTYISKLKNN